MRAARQIACEWCGFALRGTHRLALLQDGRVELELRLCARCVDDLRSAIAALDERGHESEFAGARPDRSG